MSIKQYLCITGANGFIGNHIVDHPGVNEFAVKVLTRQRCVQRHYPQNIERVTGDLLDTESLHNFLEPDSVVVNLAYGISQPRDINMRAARNLADSCRKIGVKRLVHCSTAVVAGRVKDDVVTEGTECQPFTEYERTKLKIENLFSDQLINVCDLVILRPTAVFGPGGKNLVKIMDDLRTDPRWINKLKISIYQKRRLNLVYITNVVAAILFLVSCKASIVGTYIISDDEDPKNNYLDVVRLLSKFLDVSTVSPQSVNHRYFLLSKLLKIKGDSNINPLRIYSCEKLKQIGFQKPISFQNGLNSYAKWYSMSILNNE